MICRRTWAGLAGVVIDNGRGLCRWQALGAGAFSQDHPLLKFLERYLLGRLPQPSELSCIEIVRRVRKTSDDFCGPSVQYVSSRATRAGVVSQVIINVGFYPQSPKHFEICQIQAHLVIIIIDDSAVWTCKPVK